MILVAVVDGHQFAVLLAVVRVFLGRVTHVRPPLFHFLNGIHECRSVRTGSRCVSVDDRAVDASGLQMSGIHVVCVRVKAATYECVGGHLLLADERVALEHLDAGSASQNAREKRRIVGARNARERRIQRQESVQVFAVRRTRNDDVTHCRAIVQTVDGKEARDAFVLLVDVFQEQAVAPDAEPRVDSLGTEHAFLGIQFAKWILDAVKTVLGHVRNGRTQVENSTTTYRCRHGVGSSVVGDCTKSKTDFFFHPPSAFHKMDWRLNEFRLLQFSGFLHIQAKYADDVSFWRTISHCTGSFVSVARGIASDPMNRARFVVWIRHPSFDTLSNAFT